MFNDLKGKFAVVTGSTSGIGQAIALALAQHGCYVVINGRTDASCAKGVEDIFNQALKASTPIDKNLLVPVAGDVSTAEGCALFVTAVNSAAAKVKKSSNNSNEAAAASSATTPAPPAVDILINNAGIFSVKDFFDVTEEDELEYFNTNYMSGCRLSKAFLKPMLQRNSGTVIFIASEAGLRTLPHMIPYSVSKAAQIALARGLSELTKGTRVRVNSVLPGPTMTLGVRKYMGEFATEKGIDSMDEAVKAYFKEYEPTSLVQRFLEPSEIANTVVFLASDASAAVNGSALRAEGGIVKHV